MDKIISHLFKIVYFTLPLKSNRHKHQRTHRQEPRQWHLQSDVVQINLNLISEYQMKHILT